MLALWAEWGVTFEPVRTGNKIVEDAVDPRLEVAHVDPLLFVFESYPRSVTLRVAERLSGGIPDHQFVNARVHGIKGVVVLVARLDYVGNTAPKTSEIVGPRIAVSWGDLVHAVL